MKTILILAHLLALFPFCANAQVATNFPAENLPYSEIPVNEKSYRAGSVAARLVDALGFRFYWATQGLRQEDLIFKFSDSTRSTLETIEHIYQMSALIKNATTKTINVPDQSPPLSFTEMRKETLNNFKVASEILKNSSDRALKDYTLKFKQNEKLVEFPFWNQINGPISDCIWHTGQIVTARRLSGNPFPDNVNLLLGTIIKGR